MILEEYMTQYSVKIDENDRFDVTDSTSSYEYTAYKTMPSYNITYVLLGRSIGHGGCLFSARSNSPNNSDETRAKPEWAWLRNINLSKPTEARATPNAPQSFEPSRATNTTYSIWERLKILDELRDDGHISNDEYKAQRVKILNGI